MSDKYIQKKKGKDTYLFNMRVPKALADLYPNKTYITMSLQTTCIKTARLRRDKIVGEIAAKKEKAFNNNRSAFLAYVQTLEEAKAHTLDFQEKESKEIRLAHSRGERLHESSNLTNRGVFFETDAEDLLDTDAFPDAQIAAYRTVKTGITPEGFRPTLREALHSWLERNTRKNTDTISKVKSTTDKFMKYYGQFDVEIEAIHRRDVLNYIEHTITDYSVSTVSGHLSRLRSVFKHAWQVGLIDQLPCPFSDHDLAFYKEHKTEKTQLFSADEVKQIVKWSESQPDNMHLIIKTGLYTGMRIGEICALTAKDVHIEDNITAFYVRKGKTNAAERTVPVCDELAEEVRERVKHLDPSSLLFGLEGKKASREFSRFKTKLTNDRTKKFHSFRVHMSTAFSRAGVDELTAAFILGHKGGKTMSYGYYAKADELQRLKESTEKAVKIIKRDWLS
ncbi:tyrosine-type recombinase/integrase [Vibrio breoganii]|nr:integrase [Vibrio breoganii 1C10]